MCEPSPCKNRDENVIKTTETSLWQNIINSTADQEDDSTTTTLADTAENIGTNVRVVFYIYLNVLEMICVSELSLYYLCQLQISHSMYKKSSIVYKKQPILPHKTWMK